MAHSPAKYADFEELREQAITLRRAGYSLRQIRDELKIFNNDILNQLVKGEPPPEWTKRPRAKDDLRERARELRLRGWTYNEIQAELGCSKSSVSLWVRDLPHPEPKCTPEEQRERMNAGLARLRAPQDRERAETKQAVAAAIGRLSDRELFITGVALYWAEGTKDKPHARRESVEFVNSDPGMISVFLAWLDLLNVARDRLRKTILKRHNPTTVRKNTGSTYRGCLGIKVHQGADLYRRIEGAWYGIVGAVSEADPGNRT
ncbi:hypothetical protein ACFY71_16090 [Streptomyces cinerochromogenes]|uniref:hypothetical protein n=1 Tax=Streptomyces cinerochromogenes TaxID=66422 RepID=UPI0036C2FBA4